RQDGSHGLSSRSGGRMARGLTYADFVTRIYADKDKENKVREDRQEQSSPPRAHPVFCLCRAHPRTHSAYEIRGPFRVFGQSNSQKRMMQYRALKASFRPIFLPSS